MVKILVVSPHPDDETLGAGGTLLKAKEQGHSVNWLNITTGVGVEGFCVDEKERSKRIDKICKIFEFDSFYDLELKTAMLDQYSNSEGISFMAKVIKKIQPDVLILPDYNDAHSDHKVVFDWAFPFTKSFRWPSIKYVMTMEIVSETQFGRPESPFIPNLYVDISDYMEKKIEAVKVYDTEIAPPPFPRSIENVCSLAMYRGSTVDVKYAEAFRVIKAVL